MATEPVVIDAVAASVNVPHRQCGWCTNTFPIARRPGRPLIYCSHGCRQRAYERRRGLGVLPPPDRIIMEPNGLLGHLRPQPAGYERAKITLVTGRSHALRPAGIVDARRRRLTLCGLLAAAVPGRFVPTDERACKTCARVGAVRPSGRPVQVSEELAALRAVIDAVSVELSREGSIRRRRDTRHQHGHPPHGERPQRSAGEVFAELVLAA